MNPEAEADAVDEVLLAPELEVAVIEEVLANPDSLWFNLGVRGQLYLRRTRWMLENEKREGLVIANVIVSENYRRTGVFSNAVTVVEEAAARLGLYFVFVEAIKNPVLIPALEKRGYTIRRTPNGPIDLGDLVLPALPDDIDAYKPVGKTSPQ